jgi:two-component system, cell cycle response regulator
MRVLIAEDDPVSRRLLELKLQQWGHEVVATHDGDQAWQLLQQEGAPQLAILDWMMPGMDGIQVCREVRRRAEGQYTYLLLLTARGRKEDIVEGINAGADDYLTKPFHGHELQARLRAGQRVLDLQARLMAALDTLREQATHDAMTCLWNHSAILDILQREIARAERESGRLAVMLADLDYFKRINDTHGHMIGDAVLREAAQRMSASVRPFDHVGRYGGEEFMIVLPGCNEPNACRVAERLRQHVRGKPLTTDSMSIPVTISVGLVAWEGGRTDAGSLVHAADVALYRAKRGGRDRIEVAAPGTEFQEGDVCAVAGFGEDRGRTEPQ